MHLFAVTHFERWKMINSSLACVCHCKKTKQTNKQTQQNQSDYWNVIDDNEMHKNTLQNYPDKVTPLEI